MTTADLLAGPFLTARDLTDSTSDPGYPIPVRDVAHRDVVSDVMARIFATREAAA